MNKGRVYPLVGDVLRVRKRGFQYQLWRVEWLESFDTTVVYDVIGIEDGVKTRIHSHWIEPISVLEQLALEAPE